jgi:hypothetical protein
MAAAASPAAASCPDADQIFTVRNEPGQAFHDCLRSASWEDPVRAYRIATVNDLQNPARFTEANRLMVIDVTIFNLQAYLDRNLANTQDRIEQRHIDTLNTLHNMKDEWRFETLGRLNANGVYQLITKGRSELFTSTFNALYDGFTERLARERSSFTSFLNRRPENAQYLPQFIDAVSVFGKFDDFNRRTTNAEKTNIMMTVMDGIKETPTNAATASTFIKHLGRNEVVLKAFEARLLDEYQKATDPGTKDMLGILGGWYTREQGVQNPADAAAFATMAANPRYALPLHDSVSTSNLFDAQKRNFQLHMFYNDQDGIENYASYTAQLRADGWTTKADGQGRYTHFQKSENGRTSHIYATVPTLGFKDDENYAIASGTMAKRAIAAQDGHVSVLVHRGHTYTANYTIGFTDKDTAIVALGACGGTQFIENTLKRNPSAHIVASASIGYREINNKFLDLLGDRILSGNDVAWRPLGNELVRSKGENARYYIMPDQNMMGRFVAKYLELRGAEPQLSLSPERTPAPAPQGPAFGSP